MRLFVFTSLLLLLSVRALAEGGSFSISGTVLDSVTKNGIELASVALKTSGAETIVTAVTADLDGNFSLKAMPGKYELIIAFVGYHTKTLPITVSGNLRIGKIYLSPSVNTIKEAVISAERSEITVSAEKTVFNVAQSPSNQVGTAEDVLRNMPGISVDQNGNISIIGKQGVKVLVDGRPNPMADNDLPSFLKSLPANSIESIELVTNPSARYDAEGNAGIINIKLKKGMANGFNLSVSLGIGILNRYNGNLNFNYRKNKFNIFTNYSANQSKTIYNNTSQRTITVNDSTSHYNGAGSGVQTRFNNNLKAGFDYMPDDKTTFTYTASGNYSQSSSTSNSQSANLSQSDIPTSSYTSSNPGSGYNYSVNNNVAYVKKFDSTDREFDANLNYSYVVSKNNATLNTLAYDSSGTYDPVNSLARKTNSDNGLHNVMLKLDYIHPLKKLKGYKVEAGIKNETKINGNTFSDYNLVNNAEQFDTLLSNKFRYIQNVAAAYGIMSGAYKKWFSYSAGLRIEHTFITGNYNAVNKNYIDFFPNASVAFAFNDTQNLSLSYNRRIQRPPFNNINNSITYSDKFTSWQGNPLLQPSFSNNISIAYSHNIKKHMFVLRAGGTIVNNGFTNISSVDSQRISRGTVVNGANSKACNFSLYVKLHLTDWWEAQAYYNFSYTYYGFSPGINLSAVGGGNSNLWGSLRFKFWKNAALEISGWCNTRSVNPQGANLPVGAMYASLKKSFLKDQLTVSFSGNDILNTMKWRWTQSNAGLQSTGSWQGNNRYLMVTISYRLSIHHVQERRDKDEGEHSGENGG